MDYNSDFFIIKKGDFLNNKYALKDFTIFDREIPKDFYYYYFFFNLLLSYSTVEYLDFLEFQIKNSRFGYGFVSFLKEEIIKCKGPNSCLYNMNIFNSIDSIEKHLKNQTDIEKLSQIYNKETIYDPHLKYSKEWMAYYLELNYISYNHRIEEIIRFLKEFSIKSDFYNKEIDNLQIDQKNLEIDIEELSTKGKKIMMMKELGIIDHLINKYFEKGEININHLSNIIHCFTGLGITTIQSVLNPIYNTGNDQKNNPYTNENNLDLVKAKMHALHLKN